MPRIYLFVVIFVSRVTHHRRGVRWHQKSSYSFTYSLSKPEVLTQNRPSHTTALYLARGLAVALGLLDDEDDEERQDGEHVEDVHDAEAEVALAGARDESHQELDSEPRHADRLDDEERVVVVRPHRLQRRSRPPRTKVCRKSYNK